MDLRLLRIQQTCDDYVKLIEDTHADYRAGLISKACVDTIIQRAKATLAKLTTEMDELDAIIKT